MARIGSVAVGGYFPAPVEVAPAAVALLSFGDGSHAVFDPCAGEGAALVDIVKAIQARGVDVSRTYGCEMEAKRYETLNACKYSSRVGRFDVAHGDAFALDLGEIDEEHRGATVLYLNPPYDVDLAAGPGARLETRWLRRFTSSLCVGGALLFLVPYYALAHAAPVLAQEYEDVSCFRLPDPLFSAFKQVLLIARRRVAPLFEPSRSVEAEVRGWASSAEGLPVLGVASAARLRVAGLPTNRAGFETFKCRPLDMKAMLAEVKTWSAVVRGSGLQPVKGIVPVDTFSELITRSYPVATPPRAPHIAAGIAAGAYNGAWLTSNTPGLPDLLVKGSFRKRYRRVEEKFDKDGDLTGEVQVQQPELAITVLDPVGGQYVDLRGDVAPSKGTPVLSEFSAGDLLKHYGESLLSVLRRQCPALHDPSRDEALQPPSVKRTLFEAQRHALAATLKLLRGEDRSALVLGELGSGKSTIATSAFAEYGARRPLIFCPPHLAHKSWPDQVRACLGPSVRVVILDSIEAVDRYAADDSPGVVAAVLSRETAKLGHAWRGVESDWGCGAPWGGKPRKKVRPRCPRCGASMPVDKDDVLLTPDALARRRVRCDAVKRVPLLPENPAEPLPEELRGATYARRAQALGTILAPCVPDDDQLRQVSPRIIQRLCARLVKKKTKHVWDVARVRSLFLPWVQQFRRQWIRETIEPRTDDVRLYLLMLHAIAVPAVTAREAARLYWASRKDKRAYGRGSQLRDVARTVLLLISNAGQQQAAADLCRKMFEAEERYDHGWPSWETVRRDGGIRWVSNTALGRTGDEVKLGGYHAGTFDVSRAVFSDLLSRAKWSLTPECGEPLYQAIPEPRRFPLAHYIRQRHPKAFDFLVIDEAHETANADSAQSLAAMQLVNLGLPTVALTGSVMNGYAASLFPLLWALSSKFRDEYDRDELTRFVKDCGYLKRFVEIRSNGKEREVNFGAQSDLREGGKITGQAPGVLPALLLRHLLPVAVPIQLMDLESELPPKREIVVPVAADEDLLDHYSKMESELRTQIKKDRFVKGRSGKLFGALTELASYPDRASHDTGNERATRPNAWETRYPEVDGGELVTFAKAFPVDRLLPKEKWLVRTAWAEREEGRRMLVFVWHRSLFPRVARILTELCEEPVAVLEPEKVSPKVREAWIEREVIAKNVPFLVVNPIAVQTGLNCLCPWFSTVVWYENPMTNPTVRRQANGRIRRIGQREEARYYNPTVSDTLQPLAHQLMLTKQAVSEAVDGIDPEASLAASGVGEGDALAGRDVGQALFALLEGR